MQSVDCEVRDDENRPVLREPGEVMELRIEYKPGRTSVGGGIFAGEGDDSNALLMWYERDDLSEVWSWGQSDLPVETTI